MTGIHENRYFPEKKKYVVDYVVDWSKKGVEFCGLCCLPFPSHLPRWSVLCLSSLSFSPAPLVYAVPGSCCFPLLLSSLIYVLVLLSMQSPASEGSPRVTRRRTTDGENPPPQEFDKGWSSLRGKKSTAGLSSFLSPVFTRPTPPHIPTLALSFAVL